MRYLIFLLIFLIGFSSFGKNKPKLDDYPEKINQIVFRLSCNPADRQAAKKLLKTYSEVLINYQKEIDRLQVEPDSFRWTRTYELMDELNEISGDILFNSEANRVICEPKFYDGEIDDVKQKAVQELYGLGVAALNSGGIKKAREAYFCFLKAVKLAPAYRDVNQKIMEARKRATVDILIDKVAAYVNSKNLFAVKFYESLSNKLHSDFLQDQFVNFYSTSDVKQRKISADWVVSISFIDFYMEKATSLDNSGVVYINGVAEIKVFSAREDRTLLNMRIPNQFIWRSNVPNNGSDLQGMFDSFSLSMTGQIADALSVFIKKTIY